MSARLKEIGEIDRIIHEPARLMLVALLEGVEEADFLYLLRATGMTKGNLSSHLGKLESAGYIEIQKTYRDKIPLTICRLSDKGRAEFEKYRAIIKGSL